MVFQEGFGQHSFCTIWLLFVLNDDYAPVDLHFTVNEWHYCAPMCTSTLLFFSNKSKIKFSVEDDIPAHGGDFKTAVKRLRNY